jgi:two-component sensor histidine kinase
LGIELRHIKYRNRVKKDMGEGSEGDEGQRLLEIIDEQERRIAELESESSEKDERIAELETKLREALGILYEMEAKYVVRDDEVGELDADLDVCKAKLADKEGVFEGFIDRINAMALVYGQLQSSDSGKMGMWAYTASIIGQYGFAEKGVVVNVNIPMDMALNAEIAVPCGWTISELVSNCLEHAFPDGVTMEEPPEVKVEMGLENTLYGCQGRRLGVVAKDNSAMPIKLVVSDNGVGLPGDFNLQKSQSMGMEIVKSLTDQLDADVDVCTGKGKGTKFTIRFEI